MFIGNAALYCPPFKHSSMGQEASWDCEFDDGACGCRGNKEGEGKRKRKKQINTPIKMKNNAKEKEKKTIWHIVGS